MDYSQTHLDTFLLSQTSNSTMLKGTNIQSGHLLNSFLSTYNKMKGSGTGLSSLQGTNVENSVNNLGTRKQSSAQVPEEIKENEDEESRTTEQKDINELDDSDEDEELGRSEEGIDLDQISVRSGSVKSSQSAKQKAILSPEEVRTIQAKADAEEQRLADIREHEEQAIKLNMKTQQGAKEAIKFKMRIFDYSYNFKTD